ncbi:heat shock 70 kDa protein cognate [Elysia marginata]|uniref:Heat shock 70 kDa protein cognate n=1 Tax=Elysia marginata TaxID=1093978 RepID=A0AAV4IRM2_9GAST|nr:heat shock 70 kDa protein cognate [Elysia marginata]
MEHFIKLDKKKKIGKDILKDNVAVQKLHLEVETAKKALSSAHQIRLEIESLFDREDFSEALNRCQDLFRSTMKQVLEDADLNMNDIDEIVLEGGSTKVLQLVKDFFVRKEPSRGINP